MTLVAIGPEGQELTVTGLAGERLELSAPAAFAPGTPVNLVLDGTALSGRVQQCRKESSGRFYVMMRLTSLRREVREQLMVKLAGATE